MGHELPSARAVSCRWTQGLRLDVPVSVSCLRSAVGEVTPRTTGLRATAHRECQQG